MENVFKHKIEKIFPSQTGQGSNKETSTRDLVFTSLNYRFTFY